MIKLPRRDGTGPAGSGNYKGIMGGPISAGTEGYCECPKCGTKVKHDSGIPCNDTTCPNCGSRMIRQ
jgi:DNA-directed RNA polymerase subunit RPC12/RpoP